MKGASQIDLDREYVRRYGLAGFVRLAWPIVEPVDPYVHNWHVTKFCAWLESITRGDITRGVGNVPPGSGKTLISGVFWPAYVWIEDPKHSWIFASYSSSLPEGAAEKLITLLRSKWYIDRWGQRLPDERTKLALGEFDTIQGGKRISTSVRGAITGFHAHTQVVDDPMKARDAAGGVTFERAELEEVVKWWKGTMTTRVKNPKKSARVIIMQRLHEADLAGEMLATGDYDHFCIPMRYVKDLRTVNCCNKCRIIGRPYDPRTLEGELLFPARWDEKYVSFEEVRGMGPDVAAAQFQQDPQKAGGNIFKQEYFQYWKTPPERGLGTIWISVDCTFKDKATSDFVAIQVWHEYEDNYYLLKYINERLSFTATCDRLRDFEAEYPEAYKCLIEDKANGTAVEDALNEEFPHWIELVEPKGGKVPRANATTKYFRGKFIWLPEDSADLRKQLLGFPRVRYDDLVDALSQAILRMARDSSTLLRKAMAHADVANLARHSN